MDRLVGRAAPPDAAGRRRVSAAIGLPRIPSFALTRPAASPNLAVVTEWPELTLDREQALSIPTVKTCRDLIVGAAVQTRLYRHRQGVRLAPGALITQPDPDTTLAATLAGTIEDLIYDGRAYWLVLARDGQGSERLPDGFPVRARWIPVGDVEAELVDGDGGSYSRLDGYKIAGIEGTVEPENVIRFTSPLGSVLYRGREAITQALELEAAATRLASVELPAGTLTNTSGENLSEDEADAEIARFELARASHTVAFLQGYEYTREQLSAEDLQLIEARANSATDLARLHNVPVTMASASPSGGASAMLYSNLGTQLTLLVSNAVQPYLVAIEQALSSPDVSPNGQAIAFDVATFLRSDPAELREHALALLEAQVIDRDEARLMLGLTPATTEAV